MTNIDLSQGQTGRSTRGRTPIWRISINGGEAEDITVLEASLNFNQNQHDLVTLVLASATLIETDGMVDKPIFFAFGQSPRIDTFYGYILAVREVTSKADSFQFSLLIVGATRVMQGGQPRFWRDRTVPGAIEETVLRGMLGYSGQTHNHKWKSLAQTNESDWALIVRLASRLGWDVYNRYGVVMCYDPEKLFEERGAYTHLIAGSEGDISTQDERTILDFEASETSDETPDAIGHKLGYFSGDKPQIVTQEGAFRRYTFRNDIVIRDSAEAEVYQTASNTADAYDTQKAKARLFGEADLWPGMSVDVTTSNQRIYRGRFDGRWMIDSVSHKMDRASFQTQVSLSRPGKARIRDLPYRSFWAADGLAKPQMSLSDGSWTSTWANRRSRSIA